MPFDPVTRPAAHCEDSALTLQETCTYHSSSLKKVRRSGLAAKLVRRFYSDGGRRECQADCLLGREKCIVQKDRHLLLISNAVVKFLQSHQGTGNGSKLLPFVAFQLHMPYGHRVLEERAILLLAKYILLFHGVQKEK